MVEFDLKSPWVLILFYVKGEEACSLTVSNINIVHWFTECLDYGSLHYSVLNLILGWAAGACLRTLGMVHALTKFSTGNAHQ